VLPFPHRRPGLAATVAVVLASAALLAGAGLSGAAPESPAVGRTTLTPSYEVWQRAEQTYAENRSNPLADRVWGVYQGPQDQVSGPFLSSVGKRRELLAKIGLRPRTKWYGAFVPDGSIRSSVQKYIASSQNGDPSRLVQIAVFRMEPWEGEACGRASTLAEKRSYRRWINELAAGIGDTPMLVVMQPDGPFLWCAPDKVAKARLLTYATKTLSALSRTSVYIDAGAADWCENNKGSNPARCAALLELAGVRYARGFALDSTHYTGPVDNIAHGVRIVSLLQRAGYGTKHFIIDTAKSGRPTRWSDMVPATKGGLKDNARVCRTVVQTRCVTLGIPPTVRVADPRWGLPRTVQTQAKRYVDGFVWFGRPWLHNQANPFVMSRALTMATSTPWPGPLVLPQTPPV
jgi:endoglucanase